MKKFLALMILMASVTAAAALEVGDPISFPGYGYTTSIGCMWLEDAKAAPFDGTTAEKRYFLDNMRPWYVVENKMPTTKEVLESRHCDSFFGGPVLGKSVGYRVEKKSDGYVCVTGVNWTGCLWTREPR